MYPYFSDSEDHGTVHGGRQKKGPMNMGPGGKMWEELGKEEQNAKAEKKGIALFSAFLFDDALPPLPVPPMLDPGVAREFFG